jgi:DNA repair exonuclease SbcCD ATPase subunit
MMTETNAPATRPSDELMSRLNLIASRIDGLTQHSHDTHDRIERLERRFDEEASRHRESFDQLERSLEDKLSHRLTDSVRAGIAPEIQILRPSMDAQSARLASVENRLERVETIQVESMNALDVRFGDLGFQTRLALSAGGLVTLGAIMVILLK